ncbi:MAG: glycosyltransferase family 2 protein [Pseudomonadota bacterium]
MLSVVVPVYNEQSVLLEFHKAMTRELRGTGCDWELIYIDDGSNDESVSILEQLRAADEQVAILELSRNFGKEVALSAGLEHACGDAVIIIDADLQDPPKLIHQFLSEWRAGYDVVYGQRIDRRGESKFKVTTAAVFYRLLNAVSEVEIPRHAGDFRLLSRRALDALLSLPERTRYMKGLYAWVGFPQKAVPFVREPRAGGQTSWSYWKLWNLALEGITSFSAAPLKLATYLGFTTSLLALLYAGYFLAKTLLIGNPVPGYPSLIVIILFLGGVQLICLGIIGEYLARAFQESKARTLYFVKAYHPTRAVADKARERV